MLTVVTSSSNCCLTCIYQIKKEDQGGIVKIKEEEMDDSVENLEGSRYDIVQSEDMDEDSIVHVSFNEEGQALAPSGANGGEQEENPVVNKLISWSLDAVTWPAEGFADDDPATVYTIDILRNFYTRCERMLSLDDVVVIPTTQANDKDLRPYQQVLRHGLVVAGGYNILFPHPDFEGHMMGKVGFSRVGLTVIIQAIRAVVSGYNDMGPIPALYEHTDCLNASNRVMQFSHHEEQQQQTWFVDVDPFKPEGVRSALSALQAAVRYSTAGYVIFYVSPVAVALRQGRPSALLDIHPIMKWEY